MPASQYDDVPAWFRDAGLGLFVHWGIASVHGGIDLSWGMIEDKPWDDEREISPEEYYALLDEFDPDAYDPDKWLRAAREAGAEYAVLTARHHDGFALWPSEHGDFSTKQYLDGRDFVGEFVDACRRQGLRPGLYYSPRDWHHPAFFYDPGHYEEYATAPESVTAEEVVEYEKALAYVKGQVRELVTRYGDLDVFWFDGFWPGNVDRDANELYEIIRAAQSDIVINDRGGEALLGDIQTPEGELPERPMDGPWELCIPWNGPSWGYIEDREPPAFDYTLDQLSKAVGRGGNLLLNVGPKPNGDFPAWAYDCLAELGEWMDVNEPAAKRVEAGPWPSRADEEVPVARRDNVWYLHVLESHDGPVTVEHVPEPRSVRRVRDGEPVAWGFDEGDLTIELGADERASADEVVAVTWDHPVLEGGERLQGLPD